MMLQSSKLPVDQNAVINYFPGGMNNRRKGVGFLQKSKSRRFLDYFATLLRVLQSSM